MLTVTLLAFVGAPGGFDHDSYRDTPRRRNRKVHAVR